MIRLKELRVKKGVYQKDVASCLNIGSTTYCQYETGKREPDIEMLKRLSDYFNVSIDYILGKDEALNNKEDDNILVFDNGKQYKLSDMTEEQKKNLQKYIEFILSDDK